MGGEFETIDDDNLIEDITDVSGNVTFTCKPNTVPYWQWDLKKYDSDDAFRFYATLEDKDVYKIEYWCKYQKKEYIIPITNKKHFDLLTEIWEHQLIWRAKEELTAYIAEM